MATPFDRAEMQDPREMLEDTICNLIKAIQSAEDGSEEQQRLTKELDTLYKLKLADEEQMIEIDKMSHERQLQKVREENEAKEKMDRYTVERIKDISLGITTCLTAILPVIMSERRLQFDNRWMRTLLEFDSEGNIITSTAGRSWIMKRFGEKK